MKTYKVQACFFPLHWKYPEDWIAPAHNLQIFSLSQRLKTFFNKKQECFMSKFRTLVVNHFMTKSHLKIGYVYQTNLVPWLSGDSSTLNIHELPWSYLCGHLMGFLGPWPHHFSLFPIFQAFSFYLSLPNQPLSLFPLNSYTSLVDTDADISLHASTCPHILGIHLQVRIPVM